MTTPSPSGPPAAPDLDPESAPVEPHRATPGGLAEVAGVFLKLGCLSFGGPIAHLGYLRAELVAKRKWLDDAHYGDLVALCQFLPGPASSQVVFGLGMQRAGVPGAFVASACFTLPSALLMIAFAYGVAAFGDLHSAGWLHGLKLAAVAVVAQAVWGMGKKLCTDRARVSICLASAAVLLTLPGALSQIGVIAGGGLVGWWLYRRSITTAPLPSPGQGRARHLIPAAVLALYAGLLVLLPVLTSATGSRPIAVFDGFYRSGSLVFGGGHVVLPLLRAEIIPHGWLSNDQFLAGYGAAQALPGPMFAFSAYLGTAMSSGAQAWLGGLWCLLAIFLPAWLLIGGALPFWHRLRSKRWAQAALVGANASVVGVLLAALYSPVMTEAIRSRTDVGAALVAFGLLEHWKAPPWLVVIAMAAAGQWLLPLLT
ncbi:MAG: chromate efflux transporter [Deltaproteobacteria bacterium]|nr:chromate efflux transporter [Deltaproteobacteria bacterium]